MIESISQVDTSESTEESWLVDRYRSHARSHIGGCPVGSTLEAYSETLQSDIVIALACKRWGCSHCGPIRVAQLSVNVERAKPNRFITLTTNPALWETPREAFDGVRRKLPKFTSRIRKDIGSFEYLRVLELGKNGYPHWHLIVRSPFIPQATISRVWGEMTGAPIVDVRAIQKGSNRARYVTKYMCKCKYIPWTDRRISWSRGFFKKQPPTEKADWGLTQKVHSLDGPEIVMTRSYPGWTAERIGSYAWAMKHPQVSG